MYLNKKGVVSSENKPGFVEIPDGAESAYLYNGGDPWSFIEFYQCNDNCFFSDSRAEWMPCGSNVKHKNNAVKIWSANDKGSS